MKFKEKDGSFARKQCNVGVFTQVTTIPTQHCLPLEGCVPYIMFPPHTQVVVQVLATHCSFPDIALNPHASPSCSGQIFINIVWGGPIANRIQWIGNNSSVGSLLNHPFVIEIRVFSFNPCCKTLYCYSYAKTHVLHITTNITQIHVHYSIFHYKS